MITQSLSLSFRTDYEIPSIQGEKENMINGIALIIRKEDACQFFNENNFSADVKFKRNNSEKVLHRPYWGNG